MPDLWRIGNRRTLSGEGGLRYAARWHSAGRPIVYLAESPAGALIEVLVHLELQPEELPPSYTLLRVAVPQQITMPSLVAPPGEAWKTDLAATRHVGNMWLASGASALARVPSVILPHTFNVVLNPLHVAAQGIAVAEIMQIDFDLRLLRFLRG